MSLVSGTGAVAKVKTIKCALSGWSGTGTSSFGAGSDVNCEDVEYLSIGRPNTDDNEVTEFETNKRKIKESIASNGWADWDKMEVFNDENGVNWRAFVAAQQTDATGTITLTRGTATIGAWKAKVSSIDGGDGDAAGVDSSFTPTFTILEEIATA